MMKERGSTSFAALMFQLGALLLMSLLSLIPEEAKKPKRKKKQKQQSSWDQFKNLLTCKQIQDSKIHDPSRNTNNSVTSICRLRDNSPETTKLLTKKTSSHLRKLSGCYECRAIVDPARYPLPRTTICACSHCGEVFPKMETLHHHQAVRHAVSELGPEDSSRNIVEIIFKSSWLKKENPICKIERILKVQNTPRTIQRFEDYRDGVKTRPKRNARCAADGNELLRFHCATLTCSLGARGSSSLCGSIPACGVCTIIRHGFQGSKISGIRTTASSGRAHDCLAGGGSGTRRAMLVCRVIAGRVKHAEDEDEDGGACDSVAGYAAGMYSNLEELLVFSSRAILPCFVVIYKALDS